MLKFHILDADTMQYQDCHLLEWLVIAPLACVVARVVAAFSTSVRKRKILFIRLQNNNTVINETKNIHAAHSAHGDSGCTVPVLYSTVLCR